MKFKTKILNLIIFVGILLLFNTTSYAGEQEWQALNYDVTLNDDGSMDVVEIWDIYISETNTLFKNFELDAEKYSGITNVCVKDLDTNEELTEIYEEMYHVTKDCFYALETDYNTFEIAWGVGLDNDSAYKKYEISYKVEDVVSVYNDCKELYWKFLSEDNMISADNVTGTVKLPYAVDNEENLRVWAHGQLNGEINKIDKSTVKFCIDGFNKKTMLEVRIVVEEPMFLNSTKIIQENKLDEILIEEEQWANEANEERLKMRIIFILIFVIYAFLIIFYLLKIIKYIKQLKQIKSNRKNKNIDIGEYFRDIPREKDSTPAQAAFLYYSKNNKFDYSSTVESQIFSATLLQLCLKGFISFEELEKNSIKIIINKKDTSELKDDEREIFKLLESAKKSSDESEITMKQLKKYVSTNYDEMYSLMIKIKNISKQNYIDINMYDLEQEKIKKHIDNICSAYIIAIIVSIGLSGIGLLFFPVLIEFLICIIILNKTVKYCEVLNQAGETEKQQWIGLKKYMNDFSLLKEKEVPDLVLWEKYLIYATAFGISDKVIKQLKVVYPQFNEMSSSAYSYMYLMSSSHYGSNFLSDFNKGTSNIYNSYMSAYSSAHSSSSGGGGGFSGGGGGRRRWRPVAVEDNLEKIL